MSNLIDKSEVKEEIRKYIKSAEAFLKYHHNRNDKSVYAFEQEKLAMCELLSFLDTLEVKEVDLDAMGVLAEHLIACDAHLVTPKYTDKELNLLEEWAKIIKHRKENNNDK